MKIGLDASETVGRGGIATYARNLIEALLLSNLEKRDRYYLFSFLHEYLQRGKYNVFGTYRGTKELRSSNAKEIPTTIARVLLPFGHLGRLNDFLLRNVASSMNLDVMHFLNPLNVVKGTYKIIVTIHDLAPLHEEGWVSESSRRIFKKKLEILKTHTNAYIAVSEYTKQEMITLLHIPEERITVVYEAPRSFFIPDADTNESHKLVGDSRFILYAGQLQPRKNLVRLIDAFGQVITKITPEASNVKLVLVGKARDEEYLDELKEKIRSCGLVNSVVFAGSLDDLALRKLYSTAACVAYPSLFEGFGLPVIEAMACGAAVLTSNTTSIPEVAGDAALLVDPYDTQAIADGLIQILEDNTFCKELQQKARMQAARFSWKRAAEETREVYAQFGIEHVNKVSKGEGT